MKNFELLKTDKLLRKDEGQGDVWNYQSFP